MNGTAPGYWPPGAPEPENWAKLRQECCRGGCGSMMPCQIADGEAADMPPLHGPARPSRKVGYTTLFGLAVRNLGGIEAEAALAARHGIAVDEELS